ncbi:MAG: acyl-CoA thioesterase II, partial [Pseudomonadales bacterium]
FQMMEEGLRHQFSMPDVPPPEDCLDEMEAYKDRASELPKEMQRMMSERPIEMRRVEPLSFVNPEKRPPFQHAWLRARRPLPDDDSLHKCVLAYASDMGILSTCILPHGKSFMSGLMTASLDHAMWFHRPFRVDEWILFAQDSPVSGGSRGFNRGLMFKADGTLIASVAQEGLIRQIG